MLKYPDLEFLGNNRFGLALSLFNNIKQLGPAQSKQQIHKQVIHPTKNQRLQLQTNWNKAYVFFFFLLICHKMLLIILGNKDQGNQRLSRLKFKSFSKIVQGSIKKIKDRRSRHSIPILGTLKCSTKNAVHFPLAPHLETVKK